MLAVSWCYVMPQVQMLENFAWICRHKVFVSLQSLGLITWICPAEVARFIRGEIDPQIHGGWCLKLSLSEPSFLHYFFSGSGTIISSPGNPIPSTVSSNPSSQISLGVIILWSILVGKRRYLVGYTKCINILAKFCSILKGKKVLFYWWQYVTEVLANS